MQIKIYEVENFRILVELYFLLIAVYEEIEEVGQAKLAFGDL